MLPFVWLVSTSLKPIEQTISLPLSFIPRAYYAELGGRRVEVTLDYEVTQEGSVVRYESGPNEGKLGFIARGQPRRERPPGWCTPYPQDSGM